MTEVTHEQAWRILQDRTREDFKIFLRRCFNVISPGVELEWDWYLDAISEHLEALEKGIITKLIINQPPRTLKTISAGCAFSAWLLGKNPSVQIIGASYNSDLAEKVNMDSRQVINTDWYQEIFPGTKIAADQNQKWRFLTTKQGHRTAVSVGGKVTGFGADVIQIDDPESPNEAMSDATRRSTNLWIRQNLMTRFNDRRKEKVVIVQQRVHEDDTTGNLLEDGGWTHLKLPAIFTKSMHIVSPLSGKVWDKAEGELLAPKILPMHVLENEQTKLGIYGYAGQYMQEPAPLEGGLIKLAWFKHYKERPLQYDYVFHSWDTAFKANAGSDYSCCTVWGMTDGCYHLIDVVLKKLEYPELKAEIVRLANRDKPFAILLEDKASGQSLLQELPREIKQPLIGVMPHKDKIQRLSAISIMIEGGKVWLPEAAFWLDGFIDQVKFFPNAKKDDAVDSMSQFLAWARDRFNPGDFGIKQQGGHKSAYDSLSLDHVSRDLGGSSAGKHSIGYDALSLDYIRKN